MGRIEYGWPLPKRQSYFKDLESGSAKLYDAKIEFMGKDYVLPVWQVPLGFPKYRLLNGRTSSLQQEWLSEHSDKPSDFFNGDPEREEAQKVQHELLKKLIKGADLLPYFEKSDSRQKEYLILDSLGFVINGNRRLCTWRELFAKDQVKYGHYEYVQVVVLPKADEKSVDMLEASLQVQRDIRDDYSWHAVANMLIDRMTLHKLDKKSLAKLYDMTEREVDEYIDMREYAIEYMKSRSIEGRWSLVDDKAYAFQQMVKKRRQITSVGDKKLFEVGAYTLLDDPEGGRLYEAIPDVYKFQDDIKKKLLEAFPASSDLTVPEDDLLGADTSEMDILRLAESVDKNRDKAREIIKDTVETRRLLDREISSANYVIKQLQAANAAVQNAVVGIQPETIREGVDDILKNIEKNISEIRKWLTRK